MLNTDGRRTISCAPISSFQTAVENADAFRRTLDDIESLPTFDENAAWEDEHRYDRDED